MDTGIVDRLLRLSVALCLSLAPAVRAAAADDSKPPAPAAKAGSKYISPEDGWLDLSAWLDEPWGFVPIVWPVTEPAVGYGAGVGLAFIGKPGSDAPAGFGRPNITGVAGMYTDNGSWGGAVADERQWRNEQLQTFAVVVLASINLDFYGLGENSILKDNPLTYNLEPVGGQAGAKYRIGRSRLWAGLNYQYFTTQVSFEAPPETPGLPDFERDSRIGGLTPTLTFDTRDTIFTPSRGTYVEAGASLWAKALGGDDDFQTGYLVAMQYLPLHRKLDLGLRGDLNVSFGDAPFYMRPFIDMRGVPKMQYQGEHAAKLEVELRWQFWKRFSLVGFAGEGIAWIDLDRIDKQRTVTTGGAGFRYELARRYGLHMGVDVAFGPDGEAFYVQFGSAWMRP